MPHSITHLTYVCKGDTPLFILNFFSDGSSASISDAYVLKTARKQTLSQTFQVGGYNHNSASAFGIERGADLSKTQQIFRALLISIAKDPTVRISATRFISAIAKPNPMDKVIDICICLEAIFSASTEVSFRFSLYNALLSNVPADERFEIFNMLKKLYNSRSSIVHGSNEGDETWLDENWTKILSIAKVALIQKIDFLQTGTKLEWQRHLDEMALGIKRVG